MMRASPLMPMPPIPTKWIRAGVGGSNAPLASASACNVCTPMLLLQRKDGLTEVIAPVELVMEEPERRAAGREQNDVARSRLVSRGRHSLMHPGEWSVGRQIAGAQRRLQGRSGRSREEIDLCLMTRGGLRQWRRV